MPKVVDVEAKREILLEAAARTFAEHGYRAATMAAVAHAAGVSKGSVYDYFRTKEDLFFATTQASYDTMLAQARATVDAAADAEQALRAVVIDSLEALRQHLELYPLTLEALSAAAAGEARQRFAEQMRTMYAAYREIVTGVIRWGQDARAFDGTADAGAIATGVVSAIDGLMLQYWIQQDLDVRPIAEQYLATLLKGLR